MHGIWQVTSIEKKTTNEIIKPQGTIYYMFQRTMVSLCYNDLDIPERIVSYIAHFDLISSDSIGMGEFRYYTTGEDDYVSQELVVPLDSLLKFGIYQPYTNFYVKLSKQKLFLTSDSSCIAMRKY